MSRLGRVGRGVEDTSGHHMRDGDGERVRKKGEHESTDMRMKCVYSILMSAGSRPTPTTITAAQNIASGLWNQTHYIWYWISICSEVMQCGLAFSKAGQCRIASLRTELHQEEQKRTGEEDCWVLGLWEGYWRGRQPEGSFHVTIFLLHRKKAVCLINCSILYMELCAHKEPQYMFIQGSCKPFAWLTDWHLKSRMSARTILRTKVPWVIFFPAV